MLALEGGQKDMADNKEHFDGAAGEAKQGAPEPPQEDVSDNPKAQLKTTNTKKKVIIAVVLCIVVIVFGILMYSLGVSAGIKSASTQTASKSSTSSTSQKETASVGDTVSVSTKHGDIGISVDAFLDSSDMTSKFLSQGQIKDGQSVGLLELVVSNTSYSNTASSSQQYYISLPSCLSVTGSDGVNLSVLSSGYDAGMYKMAAGGFFECKPGESERIAVPYTIANGMENVTVLAGNYSIPVAVTQS